MLVHSTLLCYKVDLVLWGASRCGREHMSDDKAGKNTAGKAEMGADMSRYGLPQEDGSCKEGCVGITVCHPVFTDYTDYWLVRRDKQHRWKGWRLTGASKC